MKRLVIQIAGAAVLASSVLVAVTPAEARHRRHWHRDRVDAGDVIAGIFLIGAIAAIADSASKSRDRDRDRDRRDDDYRYEPQQRERDYRGTPERGDDRQWVPGNNNAETRAVDACSWAAEGELGDEARVGAIDSVAQYGDDWRVSGTVAAPGTMPRDFACTYRGGRVVGVTFN
jgi:hypothetical protein